jgi:hypothetical protein
LAAEIGDVEVMKILLANGADIKAEEERGWTALHYAALNGQIDGTLLLLQKWEDIGQQEVVEDILAEMKRRRGGHGPERGGDQIENALRQRLNKLQLKGNARGHRYILQREFLD